MSRYRALIVEDDEATREMLRAILTEDGYTAHTAVSVSEGLSEAERLKPELIVLDRVLPDGDGLQLCLKFRENPLLSRTPVLMLTAKAEVSDRILGLRLGADDYLTKPFNTDELRARISALMRRREGGGKGIAPCVLVSGPLKLNLSSRVVTVRSRDIELTNKEFELLRVFMENPDRVLTRDFLLEAVWDIHVEIVSSKMIDVTVMNLRRKLGAPGSNIVAVRSFGYKFLPLA